MKLVHMIFLCTPLNYDLFFTDVYSLAAGQVYGSPQGPYTYMAAPYWPRPGVQDGVQMNVVPAPFPMYGGYPPYGMPGNVPPVNAQVRRRTLAIAGNEHLMLALSIWKCKLSNSSLVFCMRWLIWV
jgi:hypothetical protein